MNRKDLVLAVLEELYRDGEVDGADGGVHEHTIASVVEIGEKQVRNLLLELEADGRVEKVDGVAPGSLSPRRSWIPAKS